MNLPAAGPAKTPPPFKPLRIIIPVLLLLLMISSMAQWYSRNVTLPRYCQSPQQTLQNLHNLLDEQATIDNDMRRKYMIAAKLLFLYPRQPDESKPQYFQRLSSLLLSECR